MGYRTENQKSPRDPQTAMLSEQWRQYMKQTLTTQTFPSTNTLTDNNNKAKIDPVGRTSESSGNKKEELT